MTIPFIIGAYASHPAPELQEDYYKLLAQQPWINGLEMPYPGQIATDNELLAGLLAANWDFNTITAIPGTMQNVGKDAPSAWPRQIGTVARPRWLSPASCARTWASCVSMLIVMWSRALKCTRHPLGPRKGTRSGDLWKFCANGTGTVRSS